jgi:hypothetical protein
MYPLHLLRRQVQHILWHLCDLIHNLLPDLLPLLAQFDLSRVNGLLDGRERESGHVRRGGRVVDEERVRREEKREMSMKDEQVRSF